MNEDRDFSFGYMSTIQMVSQYEALLRQGKNPFFDVADFERIIEFYFESDNAKRAAEAINIASQIHPYSSEIQLKRIELLIVDGNYRQAIQHLNVLIKIESNCSEAYYLKGQCHLGLNEFDMAEIAFDKALSDASDDRVDLLCRIASLYQDITEFNSAISYLVEAYGIDNHSMHINFELGYCYECVGDYPLSIKHYNHCLDINPFSSDAWFNLGLVYTRTGDFEKAVEAYDYAIAVDPMNSAAIHNKANTLVTIGKYHEAIDELTELIAYEPKNSSLYVSMGDCYERIGNYDKAMASYLKGLEIFPSCAEAYFGIGIVKLRTMQPHLALDYINKALAIEPENYDFWLGMARVKYEVNKIDEALDAYRQATILNPDEPEAYIGLAETLLYKESFADVVELYNSIADRFSQTYPLKVICAAAMYLQNKPNKAVELLKGAKMIDSAAIDEFFSILPTVNDEYFVSKLKLL